MPPKLEVHLVAPVEGLADSFDAAAREEAAKKEREEAAAKAAERAQARAKRFLMRLMKRDRARAFTSWAEQTEQWRHLRQVVLRWQQQTLAAAFDVWVGAHEKGAHRVAAGATVDRIVARLRNQRLAAGWQQWVNAWEAERRGKETLKRVASRLRHPGLARAFVRWAEMAERRGGKLRTMRRVFQQAFASDLARAWNTWNAHLRPTLALRRAVAAFAQSALRRAWNAWVGRSDEDAEKRRKADLARNAIGKLANRDLSMAWEAWVGMVQARHDAWQLMDRVTRRWLLIEASAAWAHWRDVARELARKHRLMRSFAARLANVGVARAWASWAARAEEHRRMAIVFRRFQNQLLTRTFFAWIKFHRMQHEGFLARLGRRLQEMMQSLLPSGGAGAGAGAGKAAATAAAGRGAAYDDASDDSDDDDDIPLRERRRLRRLRSTAKVEPSPMDLDLPPMDGPFAAQRSQASHGFFEYGYGAGPDRPFGASDGALRLDGPSVESQLLRSRSSARAHFAAKEDADREEDDDGAGVGIAARRPNTAPKAGSTAPPDAGWSGDPSSALKRSTSIVRR